MPAGQPRTGDAAYADLLETTVGREHIFRGRSFLLRRAILAYMRRSKPFIHGVPSFLIASMLPMTYLTPLRQMVFPP